MKLTIRRPRLAFPYSAAPTPRHVAPLPEKRQTGIDYDTEWARSFPARVVRLAVLETVITPAMKVLASPERRGLDRLKDLADTDTERPAPVIFAANHHSHVDTPLLLSSMPEPWRHRMFVAAAADYFFTSRATSVASALALNAIPIERKRVSRRSADDAAELIGEGWSLLIYPEGGRSPDGWGQPFRGGAAYLALRCNVPVVPVHVEGTSRIMRKGAKRPSRSATRVTFGRPLWADEDEDSRRFAVRIERAVAALADETETDWYAARLRAHRDETPALSGPDAPSAWRRAWALGERGPKRPRPSSRRWPDLG
ncbi:MAG TPA: lysophospholipid acyltransferase family protein [Acidimicrobiales bacterium]|jgi:1-acyl-sn-glycerol-3-phosphate acyltransferase|nr:lysophospholipid acyltransferase family protein [Acidimicrobiales bacterium]